MPLESVLLVDIQTILLNNECYLKFGCVTVSHHQELVCMECFGGLSLYIDI